MSKGKRKLSVAQCKAIRRKKERLEASPERQEARRKWLKMNSTGLEKPEDRQSSNS